MSHFHRRTHPSSLTPPPPLQGVAHPSRIAVGGHSYGAFMTANLLAHCGDLFACGIARSGAYNRTLTPFGFQAEERTLWQAPSTYATMSPYMHANKIKTPLLLIHGEDDPNPGTFPMQSERFYQVRGGEGEGGCVWGCVKAGWWWVCGL